MLFSRGRASRRVLHAGAWAAVMLLVGTAALASESGSHDGFISLAGHGTASGPVISGSSVANSGSFTISGKVSGLHPGAARSLTLTISNHLSFAIVVTSLTTKVSAATSKCGASNLAVKSFSGHLKVPAKGKATTKVQVSMAHSAPNACQGAVFPLRYSGLAKKAA